MAIPCRIFEMIEAKEIPNTNGRYVAYSDGRIFDRKLGHDVPTSISKRGWMRCHVWLNGKRITRTVHRLIMLAFVGDSELTVNHKDGNKLNNDISNLEYMTVQEQNIHRSKVLKVGNRRPVYCLENGKTYETILDASKDLGIDKSHIGAVCYKKYGFRSVGGYHFEFACRDHRTATQEVEPSRVGVETHRSETDGESRS